MKRRATLRRPAGRRAERLMLGIAAAWCAVLAVVTLFPYQLWYTEAGYRVLHEGQALGSSEVVADAAGVIRVYGVALLCGALTSALTALRMGVPHRRGVVVWLGTCATGALLTRDVVGVLLFSVCLVLYLSRSRALRMVAQRGAAGCDDEAADPAGSAEGGAETRVERGIGAATGDGVETRGPGPGDGLDGSARAP